MINKILTAVSIVLFLVLTALLIGLDIYIYLDPSSLPTKVFAMFLTTMLLIGFGGFAYLAYNNYKSN